MALTTTATGRAATPLSETSRWLLPILLLGNVLNVVDVFVVNVALPTLTQTLHATPAALELVVAGYSADGPALHVLVAKLGEVEATHARLSAEHAPEVTEPARRLIRAYGKSGTALRRMSAARCSPTTAAA